MKKQTYIPLLVYLTKKQKTFIRNVAFKRKLTQSALIREILDSHYTYDNLTSSDEPLVVTQANIAVVLEKTKNKIANIPTVDERGVYMFTTDEDEETSLRMQDLGDEPTLPGEDEPN